MVLDLVALAHEALLVLLAHVGVQLVVSEKAFSAEFAERVDTTLDLLWFVVVAAMPTDH